TSSGERPHECDVGECTKAFTSSSHLKKHIRNVHGLDQYECSTCGIYFETLWERERHKLNHYNNIQKHFGGEEEAAVKKVKKTEAVKKDHIAIYGKTGTSQKSTPKRSRLTFAERTGGTAQASAQHKCRICARVFTSRASLIGHTNGTHNKKVEARPMNAGQFHCDRCSYSCDSRIASEIHMRIHTGDRPYKCSHCQEAFISNSHLNNHLRAVHDIQPYECRTCGQKFDIFSQLTIHKKMHRKEFAYDSNDDNEMPVLFPIEVHHNDHKFS
ncbi:hypothetical protein PENTCL1PPCAC_25729, partial [Pristionchus entomophagus]